LNFCLKLESVLPLHLKVLENGSNYSCMAFQVFVFKRLNSCERGNLRIRLYCFHSGTVIFIAVLQMAGEDGDTLERDYLYQL